MRPRSSSLPAPALLALLLVACGDPGQAVPECNPPCPAHTHCTESGCVPDDGAAKDLAMPPPADLAGQCVPTCSGATPHCRSGLCVVCLTDEHCPAGQVCRTSGNASACLPGCSDDTRCGAGQKCCDAACTDVSKEVAHCGACNHACALPHATPVCKLGSCEIGRCSPSWQDCNQTAADGCEVNVHFDVQNCASCGGACVLPNAVPACGLEGCYVAACSYGWENCDSSDKNGCEIEVVSDIKNCGACGMSCATVSRAQIACITGACVVQSCTMGFGNCNGIYNDGCEIALLNDKNNCGKCGLACGQGQICVNGQCDCPVCSYANAKAACVGKQCVIDSCLNGFANCDGNTANGCETPTGANSKNCGGCGIVCPQNLVCTNGGCTCPQCNIPNARTVVRQQCLHPLDSCLAGILRL